MSLRALHLNSLLTGGGTDDQCARLAEGLPAFGVEASVAGPDGREFSRILRERGVPFVPTPAEGPLKLRFILAVAKELRRGRHQIVHGHHGRDIWPTILAARLSGTRPKVILTRHMAKSPSSWPSRRFLLGQCDALIAVSEFTAEVLRKGHFEPNSPNPERRSRPPLMGDANKIRVIHGGIDDARFTPLADGDPQVSGLRREWKVGPSDFVFAVVGGYSLPRGKGQREFLEAAARIAERVPNAKFLIIGRGNMADILRDDIRRLGLEGRASLTPYCNDMPAAMNALHCMVHPQVGTEAFGLVVCEAHACGRSVIASALDGIPEAFVAGGAGKLVPPESVDALAAAMVEVGRQPPGNWEQRTEMHQRVAAQFSLGVMSRKVANLYRELCPESAAQAR
jgi:glycosyltransferase involved in cell wall biosynthesis